MNIETVAKKNMANYIYIYIYITHPSSNFLAASTIKTKKVKYGQTTKENDKVDTF